MIDQINLQYFTRELNEWALKMVGTIHARRDVSNSTNVEIDALIGQTIRNIGFDEWTIQFITDENVFIFEHLQNCCESVYIEDITGDLTDLIGSTILKAECRVDNGWNEEVGEEYTYTFYHLATVKGYVDIRFNGFSNGYYSCHVDILKTAK